MANKISEEVFERLELAEYIFNEQETELAYYIFNRFKNINPNTVFQKRDKILGIGDPSKHLFCYYLISNGELKLKFKNCEQISPIDKEKISELIPKTILLFSDNDLTTKRSNNSESEVASKNMSESISPFISYNDYSEMKIIDFFTDVEKAELQNDANKSIDVSVFASVRLCNCLMRASKNYLGDILVMTKGQLFKIRNFGIKCFEELFDIIKAVANGISLSYKNSGHNINSAELLNGSGNYYSYKQLKAKHYKYEEELKKSEYKKENYPVESLGWYLCIIKEDLQRAVNALRELKAENIINEYKTNKREYPQLYKTISDLLEKFMEENLKEDYNKILVSRLGINCKEETLQTIADGFGLSRERIRQKEKRAKKIFNSKLINLPIISYYKILELKEKILSVGLGGFVYALIKFNRVQLAKYIMGSLFHDTDLNGFHLIKQCING